MRFIKDVVINFISSLSLVFMIQVFLFPMIAENESPQVFGEYIYIYTIINFWAAVIGGTGNSIYLKYYSKFNTTSRIFEFRAILGGLYLTYLASFPFLYLYTSYNLTLLDFILVATIILFIIYRIYLRTWYRAMLKYNVILCGNLIIASVYGILLITGIYNINFYLTILIGEISFTLFIILFSRNIHLITPMKFKKVYLKGYIYLLISFIAVTGFKYIDKWFIEFQFGTEKLSYFYIAAITSTLFTTPINTLSSVLFSYFVQRDQLSLNTIYRTILFVIVAPLTIISIGFLIGPVIINILYASYYDEAINLFYILNIAFGLLSIDFILRGFVVKFYPEYFKMLMDIAMIIILVINMYLLATNYGLIGVSYSLLITYAIKAVFNLILLAIYYKKQRNLNQRILENE